MDKEPHSWLTLIHQWAANAVQGAARPTGGSLGFRLSDMWTVGGTIQNTNFCIIGSSLYQLNHLTVEAILVQISQWCNGAPVSTIHLVSSQVGRKELQVQWAALQVNVDPAHFFQTVVRAADHEHRSSNQQIGHPAAREQSYKFSRLLICKRPLTDISFIFCQARTSE